jgi:membrane-anchored protein YejM (alkaline phosphatase superfamily)
MIYTESPRRKQITQQVAWGHWFALANIGMAIVISSVYLFASPIADTPLSFVYMLLTWFGHISFVTFLVFVLVILPLCYQITNMRALRGIAAVVSAIGLALLAFDALIYNNTGFHISFSSAALLRSETQVQVSAFSWLQWFYLSLLFIIWLMFQLVIANAIFKRMGRLQRLRIGPYITATLVLCFVSSHAIHVWADAKLYTPVLKQDNMFPLSYPATAKTLMARYGFLDLEDRQQREELQLQGLSSRFVYPPQNVYCSVNAQSKVVVLMSNEIVSNDSFAFLPVNNFHLNTQSEPSRIFKHLQYGIPYHLITRTSSPPVMLDLLNAFSVPNALFNYADDSEYEYSQFIESLSNSDSGLYMGFLSAEQLAKVDVRALANTASVMLIAQGENQMYRMYSNFTDTKQASTNEDIAPTVMNEFECLAEVYRFSTGQALQTPSRQWLVSTMQENIFFFKAPYLTEVSKDGSYKVTDVRDQSEVLIDIDTNMLSRSIKHLENFSR